MDSTGMERRRGGWMGTGRLADYIYVAPIAAGLWFLITLDGGDVERGGEVNNMIYEKH